MSKRTAKLRNESDNKRLSSEKFVKQNSTDTSSKLGDASELVCIQLHIYEAVNSFAQHCCLKSSTIMQKNNGKQRELFEK